MTAAPAALAAGVSVSAARRQVAQDLRGRGFDSPELDARLIVGHALGLDHTGLAAQAARPLATSEAMVLATLVARRLAHEPVARILGVKEFWGLPLRLAAETLVPRPETEIVVEAALDALEHEGPRSRALRVADLGAGTGALVLSLLSELPAATGIATDSSFAALACARANAAALGFRARTAFVVCDWSGALTGPFDLLVSNPPYVVRDQIATLPPEVRDFDPHRALDGGPDGLDAYRAIAADARRILAPGGTLVMELGAGLLERVMSIFVAAGLRPLGPARNDLAGLPRALAVRALP